MPSLGDSSWCGTCGQPYLTAQGHNCPGPRSLVPATESGPVVAHRTAVSRIRTLSNGHSLMTTLDDRHPQGCQHFSYPCEGFRSPDSALVAALLFTANGITADYVRYFAHPQDQKLAQVIAEMDQLAAEGTTPEGATALLEAAKVTAGLVPHPRPAA